MKIGVIILCRYNSSRFPGKILTKINGKEALLHTYERINQIFDKSNIIVATSNEKSDDLIAAFCATNSINIYRGDLENVSKRFLNASKFAGFDMAIRTNGDNIFIDVELMKEMVSFAKQNKFNFYSNVYKRTYPKGMSIEILNIDFYEKEIVNFINKKEFYEHVTIYFYQNIEKFEDDFYFFYNSNKSMYKDIDFAFDTPEDYKMIKQILSLLEKIYPYYNLKNVIDAYKQLER